MPTGLHLNIKKTEIMTTEEKHNFNTDNKDTETVKDFTYLLFQPSIQTDCSQDIKKRLRLGRAAMEELRKIFRGKEVSLETNVKTIHTLLSPITMYRWKSWTGKKAGRKRLIPLKHGVGGELCGYPRPPERQTSGS